jgi:hypothetical protein
MGNLSHPVMSLNTSLDLATINCPTSAPEREHPMMTTCPFCVQRVGEYERLAMIALASSSPRLSEQEIHAALWQHLQWRAAPGAFAFHVPNGGARSKAEASILAGLGVVAGVPDLIVCKDGRFYALELKADGGKLSPAQRGTHERMRAAGATIATSYGLDEALRQLEDWGILRKERRYPNVTENIFP